MAEHIVKSSRTQLRILHLASGDLWAGAEAQLFNQCDQLQRNEQVILDVVLLNEGELARNLRKVGVEVTVFDEVSRSFWQIHEALVRHCIAFRPDIIHSHRQKENILASLCRLRLRIPSIRTVHGAPEFSHKVFSSQNIITLLDRWAGKLLQHYVVAVSDDLAQNLNQHFSASKVEVVRNGIAQHRPAGNGVDLAPGNTHIGIVGRLVPVKRIDIFLETAAILVGEEKDQRYRFWVVGDGPLREESVAQAHSLGIAERVEFVGHIPSALPYLQSLDLLVMCSDHEGTPMTLLEAMQCQLPIVAHDVGGLRELLDGGECGLLVAEQSAVEYANAIACVLQTSSLREKYVRNGLARVTHCYSAEKSSQGYLELYRKVVAMTRRFESRGT